MCLEVCAWIEFSPLFIAKNAESCIDAYSVTFLDIGLSAMESVNHVILLVVQFLMGHVLFCDKVWDSHSGSQSKDTAAFVRWLGSDFCTFDREVISDRVTTCHGMSRGTFDDVLNRYSTVLFARQKYEPNWSISVGLNSYYVLESGDAKNGDRIVTLGKSTKEYSVTVVLVEGKMSKIIINVIPNAR